MSQQTPEVFCANCGVEITWAPVTVGDRHYCCEDCLAGKTCECGARLESDEDRRSAGGPAYPNAGY